MPYTVPGVDPRLKWYQETGRTQGHLTKLLLEMFLGGKSISAQPTSPTSSNPGQIQFPSGAQTQTSPLEMAMINQMGGAPSRQGGTVPVSYQAPTRFGFGPSLSNQSTQADIAYKQAQTKSMTPEFQAELIRRTQGLPPQTGGILPEKLQQIEDDALAGKPGAADAYRYLKSIGAL